MISCRVVMQCGWLVGWLIRLLPVIRVASTGQRTSHGHSSASRVGRRPGGALGEAGALLYWFWTALLLRTNMLSLDACSIVDSTVTKQLPLVVGCRRARLLVRRAQPQLLRRVAVRWLQAWTEARPLRQRLPPAPLKLKHRHQLATAAAAVVTTTLRPKTSHKELLRRPGRAFQLSMGCRRCH